MSFFSLQGPRDTIGQCKKFRHSVLPDALGAKGSQTSCLENENPDSNPIVLPGFRGRTFCADVCGANKMSNVVLKSVCLAGAFVSSLCAHQAAATCSAPLTQAQISTALEGNYASGSNGSESWNEGHCAGNLYDYKKGPTDPVDPQKQVGTYSYVTVGRSGAAVRYSYTGGPIFTYFVQSISGGSYLFCATGGGADLTITVVKKAGCPSS